MASLDASPSSPTLFLARTLRPKGETASGNPETIFGEDTQSLPEKFSEILPSTT